jgi:hypothetical protein
MEKLVKSFESTKFEEKTLFLALIAGTLYELTLFPHSSVL